MPFIETSAASCSCGNYGPQAVDAIWSAVAETWVDQLSKNKPSANKWWTHEPALTTQGALTLVHRLLPRAITRAFTDDADDSSDSEEDDFMAQCRRTVRQAVDFAAPEWRCTQGSRPASSHL